MESLERNPYFDNWKSYLRNGNYGLNKKKYQNLKVAFHMYYKTNLLIKWL